MNISLTQATYLELLKQFRYPFQHNIPLLQRGKKMNYVHDCHLDEKNYEINSTYLHISCDISSFEHLF